MENKRFAFLLSGIALLLLVPLIAMQFTPEVNWSAFDFGIASILLFGTGVVCELILRKAKSWPSRLVLCVGTLLVLFAVWAELAVGVFGTPFAGN